MSSFGFAVPGPPIEPMASAIIAESPGGRRHRYWLARVPKVRGIVRRLLMLTPGP